MTLRNRDFENIVEIGEKYWLPEFSPFPTMFFTHLQTNFIILVISSLLQNVLKFDEGKIFSPMKDNKKLWGDV